MTIVYIIIAFGVGFIVSTLIEAHRRDRYESNLRAWSDAMQVEIEKAQKTTMAENLTPAHLRCSLGGCPSVTRLDDGRLLIVGASAHDLAYREDELVTKAYGALIAENKIADDETVVVISPDLLADLSPRSACLAISTLANFKWWIARLLMRVRGERGCGGEGYTRDGVCYRRGCH